MSRSITRTVAAAVLSGATLFATAGPAMAAPAALPLVPAATQFDQQAIQAVLATHNDARSEVGVAALTWSAGLADSAQAYADKLAADDAGLVHDQNRGDVGENLNANFDPASDPGDAADGWYAEKPLFDAAPNKTAFNNTNPDWMKWGHYTQMVWSTTTSVGCGTATSATTRYNVCRYSPAGNVDGQLAYPGAGTNPNPDTAASISSLAAIGVDFSVPESDLADWLANPEYTPYPAIGEALLNLVGDRKFARPLYIDVVVFNYENSPGVESPRKVGDVDAAVLERAVVEASNVRNGEEATDFETLLVPRD